MALSEKAKLLRSLKWQRRFIYWLLWPAVGVVGVLGVVQLATSGNWSVMLSAAGPVTCATVATVLHKVAVGAADSLQ